MDISLNDLGCSHLVLLNSVCTSQTTREVTLSKADHRRDECSLNQLTHLQYVVI